MKISFTNNLNEANYIVYESGNYEYDSNLSGFKDSEFYIYWNGGIINKGYLRINSENQFNDDARHNEIKKIFFRSLGYFQKTKKLSCESYLSTCHNDENNKIVNLDLELLKYHYSYGVCKGTNLKIFNELHATAAKSKELGLPYYVLHYIE